MAFGALKRLPLFKLVSLAEVGLLLRRHARKLSAAERGRLVELVRIAKARPSNLSQPDRDEFTALVAKLEPWAFTKHAAAKLSPVPVPKRFLRGRRPR